LGILIAIASGVAPMFAGRPFLTQYNLHFSELPLIDHLHIGTPLLFDIGVFLLVGFVTVKLVIVLARATSAQRPFTRREALYYASVPEGPLEGADSKRDE